MYPDYPNNSTPTVSVRRVNRTSLSKRQRALLAVRILDGERIPVGLTIGQVALLFGISPSSVSQARAREARFAHIQRELAIVREGAIREPVSA